MTFFSTTALGPHSPAFRGRESELARLLRLCREEVTRYGVVYGGRQNGKTSLLFQLLGLVEQPTRLCRIDFQQIQGAAPAQVFALVAEQISTVVPLDGDLAAITSAPRLRARLSEALARPEVARLVLVLDELGALPPPSREALGNALRSFFHDRLVAPPLQKLLVIFSGGVELYTMVVSEVSSLHNVCEEIYLPDLPEPEAVKLIADGLQAAGVATPLSDELGRAVYAQVSGHPYLTQRLGELLAGYHAAGAALSVAAVASAAAEIVADAPPLLRRIRDDLRHHQLEDAARRLLRDRPRFSRLDDAMVRLELIGLAKRDADHWAPRNALLAAVFGDLLGVAGPAPEGAQPGAPIATPAQPPPAPTAPAARPAPASDPGPTNPQLIAVKRRRLEALELQAAQFGLHTPPHITIEIEDLRKEVAALESSSARPASDTIFAPVPAEALPTDPAPPGQAHDGQVSRTGTEQSTGQAQAQPASADPPGPQTPGDRLAAKVEAIKGVQRTAAAYSRTRPASPEQTGETPGEGVTGCTEVSPGCDHCYARTFAERFRGVPGPPYAQGFDLRLCRR